MKNSGDKLFCEPRIEAVTVELKEHMKLGTMQVQGQLHVWWSDPRLALPKGADRVQIIDPTSVWSPQLDLYNTVEATKFASEKLALLKVGNGSKLVHSLRFIGKFSARLDLTCFPFDIATLGIVIEVMGNPDRSVNITEAHPKILGASDNQ